MLRPLLFWSCLLISTCSIGQYDFKYLPDAPGKYRATSHAYSQSLKIPRSHYTMTHQMLEAIVDAFKKAYPHPFGADIGPYGGIFSEAGISNSNPYNGGAEFINGPYAVYLTIPFFDISSLNSGKPEASGEYASSIEIWINNIRFLLQSGSVSKGNENIFRAPNEVSPLLGFRRFNNMILIQPPGKSLPWRPATKEEYLLEVIKDLKSTLKANKFNGEVIAYGESILAAMSAEEKKQPAWLYKQGNNRYNFDKNGKSIEFGYKTNWKGFANPSDPDADALVIIDETFYDKKLPRNSFQVMVISASYARENSPEFKSQKNRISSILRSPGFLTDLQQLLEKDGNAFAKIETKTTALDPALVKRVNSPRPKAPKAVLDKTTLPFDLGNKITLQKFPPDTSYTIIPSKNEKNLALAEQAINSRTELVNYLNDLDDKICGTLQKNYGTDISIPGDARASDISDGAAFAWAHGKADRALVMSVKAAVKNPDNASVLNNLAAMLNLGHIQYKSVPVSNYLLRKLPNNSTILNNLGQAYLSLGETQKAEQHLLRCVQKSKWHPEANVSLAYINDARKNKSNVIRYAENSLRGAFTVPAYNLLRKYKKDARLMDYVKHRYIRPEYFNPHKYKLPKQCANVEVVDSLRQVHEAYFKYYSQLRDKYYRLSKEEEKLAEITAPQRMKDNLKTQHNKLSPFFELGYNMQISLLRDYTDKMKSEEDRLKQIAYEKKLLLAEYEAEINKIIEKYAPIIETFGEGNPEPEDFEEKVCQEKDAVGNLFLQRLAFLSEEMEHIILPSFYQYMNDALFWTHVASVENHQYKASFYHLVSAFFSQLASFCHTTTTIQPCSFSGSATHTINLDMPGIKEPECPIEFSKKFFFGTISIDCEALHFSGGEGLLVDLDYEFATGAMTMAIGVGVEGSVDASVAELDFGTLSGGAEAGGSMKFFLSLDKKGHVTDGGFTWQAEAKLNEKFKSDFSSKSKSKSVGLDATVQLGFNSGYTFSGSTFKELDKIFGAAPEKQENKNIKIYK